MAGSPPADSDPEVAVVGAGAVGTTAAYDLATRGAEVRLYDRGAVGGGSTGRAAGVCYDAFSRPVNADLADRALERFRALSGAGGFEFVDCPYVWLAREGDDRRCEAIREGVDSMRSAGRGVEFLGAGEAVERFPVLRSEDVGVAAVATGAGWTDPGRYAALAADRARRAGVEVVEDTPVTVGVDPPRVVTGGGEERAVDAVLVAAGAHTGRLLEAAGIDLAVKPYRVQALTATAGGAGGTDADDGGGSDAGDAPTVYDGPMVYDATDGFYARPHPTGLLAGDGTEEREADPDGYDRDADRGFREGMPGRIRSRLRVEPRIERAWAGLCTATPDRDPLLGAVAEGVYVATGWQGHGFMRAPATAEAVAEAILRGDPAPVDPFDPRRFDGDEDFEVTEGMVVDPD